MKTRLVTRIVILCIVLQVLFPLQAKASQDHQEISGKIEVILNVANEDMEKYIDAFEDKYPNVRVKYTCYSEYEESIKDRIASGDYGDVLYVPAYMSDSDVEKYFARLGDYDSLLEKYSYMEGRRGTIAGVYGIPSKAYVLGIIYNKDVFYQAGITEYPTNFEGFLEALKAIKERTEAIPFYTYYSDPWALSIWDDFSYIEMTGSPYYKYKYKTYEKDAFLEGSTHYSAFKLLYDIVDQGLCEKSTDDIGWIKAKKMLNEGKIGCVALGSWAFNQIKVAESEDDSLGIMPFPYEIDGRQYMTIKTDYCYGVSGNSKYPEAARAFLDYMLDESGYAIDHDDLSVVKSDPYPDIYCEMVNVIMLAEAPASSETEYSDRSRLKANLDFDNGVEVKKIIETARHQNNRNFDGLMQEYQMRWEYGRRSGTVLQERAEDISAMSTVSTISQNYVVNFSKTEQEFLSKLEGLRVGYLERFAPFQYLKEDGFCGVSRDVFEIVSESIGIQMEYIPFQNVQEVIDALENGAIDIAAGLTRADTTNVKYSKDYLSCMNLLLKNDMVSAELGPGSTLAVVKGEGSSLDNVEGIETKVYASHEDALAAVESMEADYAFMNYHTADYYKKAQQSEHVIMLPLSEMSKLYMCFGEEVDTRLISICNKCIYAIANENVQMMLLEHTDPPAQKLTLRRIVEMNPIAFTVVVLGVFLFLVTIVSIFYMQRMKHARIQAMNAKRYELLSSIVDEYLFEIDLVTCKIVFDEKCTKRFGFEKEEKIENTSAKKDNISAIYEAYALMENEESIESKTFLLADKNGIEQWYKLVAYTTRDDNGAPNHVIAKLINVQKEIEEKQYMSQRAENDPLTGLYNRDGFMQRVLGLYENAQQSLPIALVVIDFDDFKSVNDTLGHAGGDAALRFLADNMRNVMKTNAIHCRYGGDEFVSIIYGMDKEQVDQLLAKLVGEMDCDFAYQDASKKLSVSVGAVVSKEILSYETLFEEADKVLYTVKEKGKNSFLSKIYEM